MNILLLSRRRSFELIIDELASVGKVTVETEKLNPSFFSKEFDVAVSYSYDHIIPAETLESIGVPVINVHPSYLPLGRGIYPIVNAAFHGHTQGISVHRLDKGIDTGPVYARQKISLHPEMTLQEAYDHTLSLNRRLLIDTLPAISAGNVTPKEQTQLPEKPLYFSRKDGEKILSKVKGRWSATLADIASANVPSD